MKIAIVGAGWFGCHIGTKLLQKGFSVEVFESEKQIFSGASGFNQNRLHLGFHYPRSYITRKQSKEGYARFLEEYPDLSEKIENNIYAVDKRYSLVDFQTYIYIMEASGLKFRIRDPKEFGLENVEGCISCDERLIKTKVAKQYFESSLIYKHIRFETKVEQVLSVGSGVLVNGEKFDLLIDCSGQRLYYPTKKIDWNVLYELCVVLVYKGVKNHPAITVMDGLFFTIYPYEDDLFTVYSVRNSPRSTSNSWGWAEGAYDSFKSDHGEYESKAFEMHVLENYPSFLEKFKYVGWNKSIRTKRSNPSDSRECGVLESNRIVQVLAGKIDHIFYAWDEVEKCIKKYC